MVDQQTDNKDQRNVLIGVDGSEHSERAFHYYLDRLRRSGDNVVMFHAQQMPQLPGTPYPYGFAFNDEWTTLSQKADEDSKSLLRHFGEVLKTKSDINFKLVKEGGKPGEVICKNIREENAHLVVMGTRGLGPVRRTFLGSVSDYVVHNCHVPVCIVPPETTDTN